MEGFHIETQPIDIVFVPFKAIGHWFKKKICQELSSSTAFDSARVMSNRKEHLAPVFKR